MNVKRIFLLTIKRLTAVVGVFVLLVYVYQTPIFANDSQKERAEAVSELADEINYFYLHPNAVDFMSSFYTSDSYDQLRSVYQQALEAKIPHWQTELDYTTLTEIYYLMRWGIANLAPIVIRRGEATAQGQDLNFRAMPATGTQVLYTLAYGTAFEIVDEVQGGIVRGEDLVDNDRWFRIRHEDQPGYVHSNYVRNLPVSEERIRLLADIGLQELRIRAKIDEWQTDFSPNTQSELVDILDSALDLQIDNWQFDLSYSELNHLLQSLSFEHLNLVTFFRFNLINDVIELKARVGDNLQGSGIAREENFTEASWEEMSAAFVEAQERLIDRWQDSLADEELESIYELLLSGLDGLELISQPDLISDNEDDQIEETDSVSTPDRRLRNLILVFAGFIVGILIFHIVRSFLYQR